MQNNAHPRLKTPVSENVELIRLAHDIKSPIKSIKGIINYARMSVKDEEILNLFDLIQKSSSQLEQQTGRILNNIVHGRNAKTTLINIKQLFSDLKEMLEHVDGYTTSRITFLSQFDGDFYGVYEEVCSVMMNLLENALKYRKPGQADHMVMVTVLDEDTHINIKIQDNGLGIAADKLNKIFHPAYRAAKRIADGYGMGLYIVGQMIHRMNGTIKVNSTLGEGACFEVRLPLD